VTDKKRILAQGCYVDDVVTRDLPKQVLIRRLTIEACVSACAAAEYKYAAVQVSYGGIYTIQQTSSKLPANVFKIHVLMLNVCWTFARSCKHPISFSRCLRKLLSQFKCGYNSFCVIANCLQNERLKEFGKIY